MADILSTEKNYRSLWIKDLLQPQEISTTITFSTSLMWLVRRSGSI